MVNKGPGTSELMVNMGPDRVTIKGPCNCVALTTVAGRLSDGVILTRHFDYFMPAFQAKDFCFTLNNYTEDELLELKRLENEERIVYLVCGEEVGESGTPHLQGFVQFERKISIAGIKKLFGSTRLHVEVRRGTPEQAADYCKKENNYFEFGSIRTVGQGHRSDLARSKEILDKGGNLTDVADQCFDAFIKYNKGLQLYLDIKRPVRTWQTQVIWLWGRTGSGKSRKAFEESYSMCNGSVAYIGDTSLKWYNPYRGERGIVLDDFDGDASLPELLQLLDRYPKRVPVKGGFVEFVGYYVWITSNRSPFDMYGQFHQWEALNRRLTENGQVIEMN